MLLQDSLQFICRTTQLKASRSQISDQPASGVRRNGSLFSQVSVKHAISATYPARHVLQTRRGLPYGVSKLAIQVSGHEQYILLTELSAQVRASTHLKNHPGEVRLT
jgi:hypothetical protein